MWHQNRTHTKSLIFFTTGFLAFCASGRAESFAWNDAETSAGFFLQGDATFFQERVRLTPAASGKVGGMWFKTKVNVKEGFETRFRFQITESAGADGLALVIQNNEKPMLGGGGSGIGYWGVPNTFAVKFDNYHNWSSEVSPG